MLQFYCFNFIIVCSNIVHLLGVISYKYKLKHRHELHKTSEHVSISHIITN